MGIVFPLLLTHVIVMDDDDDDDVFSVYVMLW